MNSQKGFCDIFWFCENILKNSHKTVCQPGQRLRQHNVCVVNDFADTESTWSLTAQTPCQRSQRLRWNMVNYFTLEKEKTNDKSYKK